MSSAAHRGTLLPDGTRMLSQAERRGMWQTLYPRVLHIRVTAETGEALAEIAGEDYRGTISSVARTLFAEGIRLDTDGKWKLKREIKPRRKKGGK